MAIILLALLEPGGCLGPWKLRCSCLQGALALLDIETGVESLSEVEAGAAFFIMLFLTAGKPKRTA